jgi:hypothetical protein
MQKLEIAYRPAYWTHPLLAEIQGKPSLSLAHENWRSSELLDLAFALETRIGNLIEIVRHVDDQLRVIGEELEAASDIDDLISGGYAYRMQDEVALRRVLIGLNCFIVESRACFENLARFYRLFVQNYLGESVSQTAAYEIVATSVPGPEWANDLRLLRHDIVHERCPWIRFDVRTATPRFEPVLVLEYRASAPFKSRDEVSMETLRGMRINLRKALDAIRTELISRVRGLR